ncbi:hypothetical protein SAMN05421505_112221 [Sinosporangium album]|uniref:Uncharacterized protein n=1 Tax=Sinosporangium album TaxID=504805 RepID=A0A1G8AM17_9ACTN|nr:hypothetical protein [Sinosporangium album]SDH21947.1 hypothetical protein SAMN05421505_112221 [Sinosporangium album]
MSAKRYAGVLTLAVALLAGCGGSQEPPSSAAPATTSPASGQAKLLQLQNAISACMKSNGFKYIAYAPARKEESVGGSTKSGDYEAMRKIRSKYGYTVFAINVYGPSPEFVKRPAESDPNREIQMKLSPTQRDAYRGAIDSCTAKAAKSILNLDLKTRSDLLLAQKKAADEARDRHLNGDSVLVGLAQKFGDCMKVKGYTISSLKPVQIANRGATHFLDLSTIATESSPEQSPQEQEKRKQQDKAHLDKEIKDALDDLECGKEFYAAYMPKESDVTQKVQDEYGVAY